MVISVRTYSPPGYEQTHTHDYSTYPESSRHAMQLCCPLPPAVPCSLSFEPVVPFPGIHSLYLYNPLSYTPPEHMHIFFLFTLFFEPGEDISSTTVCDDFPRLGGLCLKQVFACVLGVFLGWTLLFDIAPHPPFTAPKKEKCKHGSCSGFECVLV